MEKSASRITLAHGPGHAAAGAKENNFGEKSLKAMLLKSGTTQGVVSGRGTGGSAVAVLAEPICEPGAGMAWAALITESSAMVAISALNVERKGATLFFEELGFIVFSKIEGNRTLSDSHASRTKGAAIAYKAETIEQCQGLIGGRLQDQAVHIGWHIGPATRVSCVLCSNLKSIVYRRQ